MPVTPITTDIGNWKYEHPNPIVYVSDTLAEAAFQEQPYLRVRRLRQAAAPEIDHCILEYEFGRIIREDGTPPTDYSPLDLVGKFVKVEIAPTVSGDEALDWYGIVEVNNRSFHGTGDSWDTEMGRQTFTAFGVLRLLDKQPILKTYIDEGLTDPLEISEGLTFQSDEHGGLPMRGNRGGNAIADSVGSGTHSVFSQKARDDYDWDAYEAVKYILERHAPVDAGLTAPNRWALDDSVTAGQIDWYDIAVKSHGRTVKAVLDDLIPRHRGVGYTAQFEPSDDSCRIKVFSFADADITLPSGATLQANANLKSLDFDQAYDIEDCQVTDVKAGQFNRVIVEGERRTTTFSAALEYNNHDILTPDWDFTEETQYGQGASGAGWYSPLSDEEKKLANGLARANPKWRHIFTRFRMQKSNTTRRNRPLIQAWDGQNQTGTLHYYQFSPTLGDTFDPEQGGTLSSPDEYLGTPTWVNGIRFLRTLPLFDRYDYTLTNIADRTWKSTGGIADEYDQPDYLQPFAFGKIHADDNTDNQRWVVLNRMHETSFDTQDGRQWSCGLQISTTDPSVMLSVHPNHFIAKTAFNSSNPEPTAPEQDPNTNGGLDPSDIWVTLCAELPERIMAERVLDPPPPGVPETQLRIEAPDCRLDWVCPYTVVELRNGQMMKTTSGGFVRDDRDRLKDIARAAAEWYGRTRQTLRLSYKTLRNLFRIGWLITDFGSFQRNDVNTVVTAIDYDFGMEGQPGRTTIETSFAQLDIL